MCLQKARGLSETEVRNRNYLSSHFALKHLSLFSPKIGSGGGGAAAATLPAPTPFSLFRRLFSHTLCWLHFALLPCGAYVGHSAWGGPPHLKWASIDGMALLLCPASFPLLPLLPTVLSWVEAQYPRAPLPEPARLKCCLDPRYQSDLCQSSDT